MLSKRELEDIKKRMKLFPGEYKIVRDKAYTINDFTGTESSEPRKIKDEISKGTINLNSL